MTAFCRCCCSGNHLGADRDAGQVLEFLVVLGEEVAARALDQEHLDLFALEALPVERALRERGELAGAGNGTERRRAEARLQQAAALDFGVSPTILICHGFLPSV